MVEIDCAQERLWLLPDKAVFWPAQRSLIIADMHLGKPAAFRTAGIAVPETTTAADLARLETLIRAIKCRQLIILGDLLHARTGMQSGMMATVEAWRATHASLEIVLVRGNHDLNSGPTPESWKMDCMEGNWECGPFLFSHEPMEDAEGYVMAGHIHPAIVLRENFGPGIRAACFCVGKRRAILPAFGSFTGMSNIEPVRGDRIFAIGEREVIELK